LAHFQAGKFSISWFGHQAARGRCLTILPYPCKVYHQVRGDKIRIIHIRDSRRAPWKGAS
jgi:hypothetical protein